MNTKTNDILNDIIHLASQAIITDDEVIKNQALGDIYDSIASVMPVNAAAEGRGSTVTGDDGRARTPDAPSGFSKFLTVADGVKFARFSDNHFVKLIAKRQGKQGNPPTIFEILVGKAGKIAECYRGETLMFKVEGRSVGHSIVEKMAISAFHRYFREYSMSNEKKKRRRARKAAEKAAAEARTVPSDAAAEGRGSTVDDAPVTVGCPSLVPPFRLPAGFDGVEPTQEDLENA